MDHFFEKENEATVELTATKTSSSKLVQEGHLTVDVFQTGDEVVVQSAIAGTKDEDIDIVVTKDMVTIKGRRTPEQKTHPSEYDHRELYWGPFSRAIILPVDVDADNAKASLKSGILTIRLPKLGKNRSKKLKIER